MSNQPSIVAEQYLSERVVSRHYARQLRKISGRIDEFSATAINAYLRSRLELVSPTTVSNEKRLLRTLWSYAYDEHLADTPPRALLKIRPDPQPVVAWTLPDLQTLVKSIEPYHETELRNGINRGTFLECWVRLAYDTGARYGDVFSWRENNVRGLAVHWATKKTGVICCRAIKAETKLAVCDLLNQRRVAGLHRRADGKGSILGGICCHRYSFTLMRKLLESAGLDGSAKYLRRSAATHVEMQMAGAGQRFLGHRSPGMAERHYLDRTQLESGLQAPWPLMTAEAPAASAGS